MAKWTSYKEKEYIDSEDTLLIYDPSDGEMKQVKGKNRYNIDAEMSDMSEYPVQNKVVKAYVDDSQQAAVEVSEEYTDSKSSLVSEGYEYVEHELGIDRQGEPYIVISRSTKNTTEPTIYIEGDGLDGLEVTGEHVQILSDNRFGQALAIWNDEDSVGENYAQIPTEEFQQMAAESDGNITIAAWLKVSDKNVEYSELIWQAYIDDDNWLGLTAGGKIIEHVNGADNLTLSSTALTTWEWMHVVFSANYEGAHLYINGEEAASSDWNLWSMVNSLQNAVFRIGTGGYTGYYTDIHSMMIHALALYDTVLSADEIYSMTGSREKVLTKSDGNLIVEDWGKSAERTSGHLYLTGDEKALTIEEQESAVTWTTYTDDNGYERYNNYSTGAILYFAEKTEIKTTHPGDSTHVTTVTVKGGSYYKLTADWTEEFHEDKDQYRYGIGAWIDLENSPSIHKTIQGLSKQCLEDSSGNVLLRLNVGRLTGKVNINETEDGVYVTDSSFYLTDNNDTSPVGGAGILLVDKEKNYVTLYDTYGTGVQADIWESDDEMWELNDTTYSINNEMYELFDSLSSIIDDTVTYMDEQFELMQGQIDALKEQVEALTQSE